MADQPTTEIREIRVDSLVVHPVVRRHEIDWRFVKKLTDDFAPDAVGVLHAVEYRYAGENRVWVIDGNHRLKTLTNLGLGGECVSVMVHLNVKDDAGAATLWLALHNTTQDCGHNPRDTENCECEPCRNKRQEETTEIANTLRTMVGLPAVGDA